MARLMSATLERTNELWEVAVSTLPAPVSGRLISRLGEELRRAAYLDHISVTSDPGSCVVTAHFEVEAATPNYAERIGSVVFRDALMRAELDPSIGTMRVRPVRRLPVA